MADKIDALFDDLQSRGFAKDKTREDFRNYMLAPGTQGYQNRKDFFDDFKGQGLTDLGTYEDFAQLIGLRGVRRNQQQSAAKPVQAPSMDFAPLDTKQANRRMMGRGAVPFDQQDTESEQPDNNIRRIVNGNLTPKEQQRAQKRMQQRMDEIAYEGETGNRMRQPVKDIQFEAPAIERDEFGNVRRDENGNPLVGFTTDENAVSEHRDIMAEQAEWDSLSPDEKRRRAREAKLRAEEIDYTEPTLWDTISKKTKSSIIRKGAELVDFMQQMTSGMYVEDPSSPTGYTRTATYEEQRKNKKDPLTRMSDYLHDEADVLSRQGEPLQGRDFLDLLWDGEIGAAMQKGVGVALESLPMTLSAYNPVTMAMNGILMASGNYRQELLDNPDIPAPKRFAMAVGSAAIEQIVEKYSDPVFKYVGGSKILKGFAKEGAEEIAKDVTKKATETLAQRIFRGLGGLAKDAAGEATEEIITDFGNDALGELLDLASGDKDYGIRAQWEQMKRENPNVSLKDFAWQKAKEYINDGIAGGMAGAYTSGTTQASVKGLQFALGNKASAEDITRNPGARIDPVTMEVAQSYDDGYTETEPDLMKRYNDEAQASAADLPQYGKEFAKMVMESESPVETMDYLMQNRNYFTDEQIAAASDFYQKMSRVSGVMDGALDRIDQEVENANAKVRYNTHQQTGSVITAQVGDRPCYITGGDVVTDEATGMPVLVGTGGAVVVRDAETGVTSVHSPQEVRVTSMTNADEMQQYNETVLRQQLMQQADEDIAFGSPANEVYQLYDTVTLNDGEGNTIEGTVVQMPNSIDGVYQVQTNDTNEPMKYLTADELNRRIATHNGQEVQRNNLGAKPDNQQVTDEGQTVENQQLEQTETESVPTVSNQEQPQPQPSQGGEQTGGEAGAENGTGADEQPVSALSKIPVLTDNTGKPVLNKKGKPQYQWHKASVEDAAAALIETTGGDKLMARDNANRLVKTAQAKLEKIRKQEPKGEDPLELAESSMEIKRAEDEVQATIKQWRDVASSIQKQMDDESEQLRQETEAKKSEEQRQREAEEARLREEKQREIDRQRILEAIERDREKRNKEYQPLVDARKEMEGDNEALAILNDTEPRSLEEHVSSMIRPHSMLWQDASDSETGLQSELGLKRGDMQRMMSLLGNKESGAKPFGKVVLDIYEGLPEAMKDMYTDEDVRNTLLNLFGEGNSTRMMHLTEENRIAEARETMLENLRRDAEAEMEAWAETYHLTPEERETFEDFMSHDPALPNEQEFINQIIEDEEQNSRGQEVDLDNTSGTAGRESERGEEQVQGESAAETAGADKEESEPEQGAETPAGEQAVSDNNVPGGTPESEIAPSEQLKPTDLRDAVRAESPEIGVAEANAKARKAARHGFDRTPPTKEESVTIIKSLIDWAKKKVGKNKRSVISGVTDRQLKKLAEKGIKGVDSEYVHSMESSNLIHEDNRHAGDSRGQIPLTEEELSHIVDVLEDFDDIVPGGTAKATGLQTIRYEKKSPDGTTTYYVEEIRTGRKSLAFKTAYKKINGTDSSDGLMPKTSPSTPTTLSDNLNSEGKDTNNSSNLQEKTEKSSEKSANKEPKRLVSDSRMEELKKKLRNKIGGQLNVGVDPEILAAGAEMAVGYLERGITRFADFARTMIEEVGDFMRPYLKSFYNAVRDMPEAQGYADQMDDYETVRQFDVHNFDKGGKMPDAITRAQQISDEQTVTRQARKIKQQHPDLFAGDLFGKQDGNTSSAAKIAAEEDKVDTNPSEAQKEAGNYQKGHIKIDGYDISIENPKGSVRRGVDANGKPWETEMHNTYGYIRGTEGVDGDHIDVFLSDDPTSGNVYVVDQVNPETGEFDEHKVLLSFGSEEEAREAYLSNYEKGWKGLGNITEVSREDFKKWIESSHRKTKPFAEYAMVKEAKAKAQHLQAVKDGVAKHLKKYRTLAPVEIIDVDSEETDQSLKDTKDPVAFDPETKKILIFANNIDEDYFEEGLFHESVHRGLQQYYGDGPIELAEAFWETQSPDKPEVTKRQKETISKEYAHKPEDIKEEYFVHLLSHHMKKGSVDKILSRLSPEHQEIVNNILHNIGYDTAEETKRRAREEAHISGSPENSEKSEDGRGVTSSTDKIEDVGEVIEGARKDMRRKLAQTIESATKQTLTELPFSKAYKKPDLKKAVEEGAIREKDATFYDAWFATMVNPTKPKLTQSEMRSKRWNPAFRSKLERWVDQTYDALQMLKAFIEADEAGRDNIIEKMTEDRFPDREAQLAEIEKRKEWNKDRKNLEWGDKTTPNPLWVTYEVMRQMGYAPGDKLDIPYGIVVANSTGTGYTLSNNKDERYYDLSPKTVEEAIDDIVYLTKIKRGDTDIQHPVSMFYTVPTKSEMGETGKYRVIWGSWRNPKRQEFDNKEDADAFAQKKGEAIVSPISEVVRRFGYKVMFRHPLTGDKMAVSDQEFDTKNEANAYLDENYDALNEATNKLIGKDEAKAQKKELTPDDMVYTAMVRGKDGKYTYGVIIDKQYANNFGMPLVVKEGFATRDEAKRYADSVKQSIFDTYKSYKSKMKSFTYFDTGKDSRAGEDYRGGKDVTAEDFMNTFGFRGVQFGNWTNQRDRQMAVNQAYDSFMDLAKLIGVSPKALSLNGELGIAFGARGSGNFAAHYEPGEIVINLTKTMGAGSLAHEWWHALDNYFARNSGQSMGMVTDDTTIPMRKELRDAYNALTDQIRKSSYYTRSRQKGDYWGRMHEVTARLLAEWVDQELKKNGELNTFLSRGANTENLMKINYERYKAHAEMAGKEVMPFDEFEKLDEAMAGSPYPSKAEVEKFGDAMRNIFDVMEERTDPETGKVALYQKVSPDNVKPQTEADNALRDKLIEEMRNAGIDVITDTEEGQKVLDEANGKATLSKGKKRAVETASLNPKEGSPADISTADGAKIQKKLESYANKLEKVSNLRKNFLAELAEELGATSDGSKSKYATFITRNGDKVTIRLGNHNATVSNFDYRGEDNGISIVVSRRKNEGVKNDGNAHIVEAFYPEIALRKAYGKPLADIVRSINEALNSGKYTDTTGLAEIEEVNTKEAEEIRQHKVYHGSGAEFDAFDHSHMGEGEGSQAFGWGTYVTDSEGIGKSYAYSGRGKYLYKGKNWDKLWHGDHDAETMAALDVMEMMENGVSFTDAVERAKSDAEKSAQSLADDPQYKNSYDHYIEKIKALDNINEEDFSRRDNVLYDVEIPDDTGNNYIDWKKPLTADQTEMVKKGLATNKTFREANRKLYDEAAKTMDGLPDFEEWNQSRADVVAATGGENGERLYKDLAQSLGSEEAASKVLNEIGFTGIKYPAGTIMGNGNGATNYVIFNEGDAKITNRTKFFRTKDGQAYGYTYNGKIYIDPSIATSETPIHEYTHLWAEALRQKDPETWKQIVEVLKNDEAVKPFWDKVAKQYPELKDENDIADEVLAQYSGQRGSEQLREVANEIQRETPGIFGKAQAVEALRRMKNILSKFWKAVADMMGWQFTNAQEIADKVLYDLLSGVNPKAEGSTKVMEQRAEDAETIDPEDAAMEMYNKSMQNETKKWQEAWQDSMISLKSLQDAIAQQTGNKAKGAEDAYSFENRMHGRSKNMGEQFDWQYYQPMLKAFDDFCKAKDMTDEQAMDYLVAKHGLERNMYYAFRDAMKRKVAEEIKEEREKLEKAYALNRISEDTYKDGVADLRERELNGVDEAIAELQDSEEYNRLKDDYQAGRISHSEFLKGNEELRREATRRKKPRMDQEGHIISDNYYDENATDYSGLTETFAKQPYDEAQKIKRKAQREIDPKTRKMLWQAYDVKMREAYALAKDEAENRIMNAEHEEIPKPASETASGRLWNAINAATKKTLQYSYESGMMDRKTYNKVREMFDFYIPLRGWDENRASDVYSYVGRDNVFSPAVKKTWGRKSKADSPLAYIGNIAMSTIISGHHNQMKQHFLNYVLNNPTSLVSISESWYENIGTERNPIWILRSADTAGKSADEIAQIVNDFNEEMAQKQAEGKAIPVRGRLRLDVHATQGQKAEHVVEVQRAGRNYQMYINGDPRAAQALNGTLPKAVTRISNTAIGKELTKLNRNMAAFFTSKNPAFVVSNLSRDLNMAGASVAIKEGPAYNAQFIKNVAKVLAPRMGESSIWIPASKQPTGLMPSLMRKWKKGTLDTSNETERLFKEFMDEGGETGFVNMLSVDSFKEKMQKEIAQMHGSDLLGRGAKECSIKKGLRLMGETFEFYNRCAEDATRFIVYMTSRQMGKTLEESIADAKDVTLNFNRKGTGAKGNAEIRDLFIFVNPAIQALANMYKMATGRTLKFAGVTALFFAGGVIMPIINQWLLKMFGDDDDKEAYWNLPPWIRKNNLVFWIPFTKNFVTIPLAQEFRVFYGAGEMLTTALSNHQIDKPVYEILSSVADLVPINPMGNGGNLMIDLAPTGIQPLSQLAFNTDFTGKPIWRENQGNKHAPMYTKAYVTTPNMMIKISEKLNDWTGGNEGKKGLLDEWGGDYINNPAVWNHLLQGYLGGMYNTIAKTADVVYTAASGEMPKVMQMPVINRFLNRPVERENAGVLGEDYYRLKEQRDALNYELRTFRKKAADGDEEAQKRVDEILSSDEWRQAEVFNHYEKIISDLRNGEQAATESADKGDIKKGITDFKQQMMEELNAIGDGKDPLEAAMEKFGQAEKFAEKNKLRMRIERLMGRTGGNKQKTSEDEVEKALSYIRDEEDESRDTDDNYLMLATSEDIKNDALIKVAKSRIVEYTKEYKRLMDSRAFEKANEYRQDNLEWFKADDIIKKQSKAMKDNKKQLGHGHDAAVMKNIANNRNQMLKAIERLKIGN